MSLSAPKEHVRTKFIPVDIQLIYIIKQLILPISSLLLISISSLFLIKNRQYFIYIISFSLVTLLLLSLPIVAKNLAASQENHPPLNLSSLTSFKAQAIVVLGGGLRYDAPEYPQQVTLSHYALERIRYAALLAKQTQLPILVTGGKVLTDKIPSEASVMATVLKNEFNQSVRWQEENSRNTAENALYSKKLLHLADIKRIILITHAIHMHRALTQFQQQGLQVLPAPTVFLSTINTPLILKFIPSARALEKSTFILHEIMGRAWYKLRY